MVFFINAESLHSCVPCGRFFHSAEAPFHQPPQHLKQACSLISFHKSQAIAFRVLADAYQSILFCVKNYKIIPTLQCICSIHYKHQRYFVHYIQSHPCPILLNPIIPLKETKFACGRFFHYDAFRSGRSLLASAPDPSTPLHLHSISHLRLIKQACACIPRALVKCRYILQFHAFAPLPGSAYPMHSG